MGHKPTSPLKLKIRLPQSTSCSVVLRDKEMVLEEGVTKGKESTNKSAPKPQEQTDYVETREATATLERVNEKSTSHKDPGLKEDRGKQETTPGAET